jgi:hypothetical protein
MISVKLGLAEIKLQKQGQRLYALLEHSPAKRYIALWIAHLRRQQ